MNPINKIALYINNFLDDFIKNNSYTLNNQDILVLLTSLELNGQREKLFEIYEKILNIQYYGRYDQFFSLMNNIFESHMFNEYIKTIDINIYKKYNNHMVQSMAFLGLLVQNEKIDIVDYIIDNKIKIKFLYEYGDYCILKDLYNKNRNISIKLLNFLIKENEFSYEDYVRWNVRWKDDKPYEENIIVFFKNIIKNDIYFLKETSTFFKDSFMFDFTLLNYIKTYKELEKIRFLIEWTISNEKILEMLFEYKFNNELLNDIWIDENFVFNKNQLKNKIDLSLIDSANLIIREIRGKNEK